MVIIEDAIPVENDISVLSTHYYPDIREAESIRSRLRIREEQIHDLDMRIQELCAQRDALCRMSAIGKTLLAPVRKLPAETLGEILLQCIPAVVNPYFESRPYRVYGSGHALDSENHPTLVRQCLGSVCRRWRNVVRDTPRAWSALILNHPLPDDLTVLQTWLRNSKLCPLDVNIIPDAWDLPSTGMHAVMNLLRAEVKRIRCFFADMDRISSQEEYLHTLFPSAASPDESVLEAFGVQMKDEEERIGNINSPKLQSLDLWGPGTISLLRSLTAKSLPSLRRLRLILSGESHTMRLSCLPHFPQLEVLHLDYHAWIHMGGAQPSQPPMRISLPSLKGLSLTALDPINARNLLPPLHIPLVERLHLGLPGSNSSDLTFDSTSISWVFNRHYLPDATTSLQCLTLDNVSLTGDDLRQWLPTLSNLRTLRIVARTRARCLLGAEFFSIMSPVPAAPSSACPRLERLILRKVGIFGRLQDDLIRLVRERTQLSGEDISSGSLQYLEVSRCPGMDSLHLEALELIQASSPNFQFYQRQTWWSGSSDTWEADAGDWAN